jgi:hypothetical protein
MRRGVLCKNIWKGASERRNENIIVTGTLKNISVIFVLSMSCLFNSKKAFSTDL